MRLLYLYCIHVVCIIIIIYCDFYVAFYCDFFIIKQTFNNLRLWIINNKLEIINTILYLMLISVYKKEQKHVCN